MHGIKPREGKFSKRIRVLLAILVIGLLCVVHNYCTCLISDSSWVGLFSGTLTNLISVLLVVVFGYLALRFLGISDDNILFRQLISELKKISKNGSSFISFEQLRKQYKLHEIFESAERIDFLGYSCVELLRGNREKIFRAVVRGAKIRFLILRPGCKAVDVMHAHQKVKQIQKDIEMASDILNEIEGRISQSNEVKGLFEKRFTDWIPSCTLIIANPERIDGKISLRINPPNPSTPKEKWITFQVVTKKYDLETFDYFVSEFDALWKSAELNEYIKPINPMGKTVV